MGSVEDMVRITDKIRKLLALSKSSNPNEAALAMERAQELLTKYNLDMLDIKDKDEFMEYKFQESHRLPTWKLDLYNSVAQFCYCRLIWRGRAPFRYIFIGRVVNVKGAEILVDYLTHAIDRMATALCPGDGKSAFNAYKQGVVDTLAERMEEILREQRQTAETSQSTALVVQESSAISAWIEKNVGPIKSTSRERDATLEEQLSYNAGREDGNAIGLDKQLH